MRLSLLSALSLPLLALAHVAPVTGNDLRTFIPGDSPIDTCMSPPPETDLIDIQELTISPNPPMKGANLTINARGTIKETIAEGAYVDIVVKYGLIKVLQQRLDLCEQTEKIDLACPIEAGDLELERVVELPKIIPPGRYTVQASVFTVDARPVSCLVAHVAFH